MLTVLAATKKSLVLLLKYFVFYLVKKHFIQFRLGFLKIKHKIAVNLAKRDNMKIRTDKLFYVFGFATVAIISTWATVESIERLVAMPKLAIWPLSILFFWAASVGFHKVIQAFDYSERLNNRLRVLITGIFLVVLFWVFLILPTNAHTFFYKRVIPEYVVNSLNESDSKLSTIREIPESYFSKLKASTDERISDLIGNHTSEVLDPNRPGPFERAEMVLVDLDKEFSSPVQRLKRPRGTTFLELDEYTNAMEVMMQRKKDVKLQSFDRSKRDLDERLGRKELDDVLTRIKIEKEKFNGEPGEEVNRSILNANGVIDKYNSILAGALENYDPMPKVGTANIIGLENVFVTWKRFFKGGFEGMGFWYFVLGAALIDILGFYFYHLAFKDTE